MSLNIELLSTLVSWAIIEDAKEGQGTWAQNIWARGVVTEERIEGTYMEDQAVIECGTAFCIAGNACATAGDKFVIDARWVEDQLGTTITAESVYVEAEKSIRDISSRALDLLGLASSYIQDPLMGECGCGIKSCHIGTTLDLFEGNNDIDTVVRAATLIADKHGYELNISDEAQAIRDANKIAVSA